MDAPTPSRPLRVIQISDPHLFARQDQTLLDVETDSSLRGVIRHIQEHEKEIDLILATGDIAQDGSVQAYQRFLDLTQPLVPLLRGLPGNHDSRDAFYGVWGDRAQAITDVGRWRMVLLDSCIAGSSAGHLAQGQRDLVRRAIQTAEERHILIAVHHNPVPIGSGWLDTMMIDNGHELLGLLHDFPNVRGLIWGHVHQEFDSVYNFGIRDTRRISSDAKPQSAGADAPGCRTDRPARPHTLRLLAAPATCVQFMPRSQTFSLDNADPGYRRLVLHDDGKIESDIVRVAGLGIKPDTDTQGY